MQPRKYLCCNRCCVTENRWEGRVNSTKVVANHIWLNPFLSTCDELKFCFLFSQSWSQPVLCQTGRGSRIQNLHWLWFPASQGSMPDSLSMWVTLAVTAWMVSLVPGYENTVSLPDIENEDFIKDCVRFHNKFRSEVYPRASDMLYMVRKISVIVEVSKKSNYRVLIVEVNPCSSWTLFLFHCD